MAVNDYEKARILLTQALEIGEEASIPALPFYNLSILETKLGNYSAAVDNIEKCIEVVKGVNKKVRAMACLVVPKIDRNSITFDEVTEVDLYEKALVVRDILHEFLNLKK